MRWLLVLASVVLVGCSSSGTRPPTANPRGYDGPPLSIGQVGDEHLVVLTAPTAGWTFSLDEIRPRMGGKDVFVTVRRPNPAYLHTQAEVEQNLGTRVALSDPIDVYARVLDFDDKGKTLVYYYATASE